MEIVQYLGHVSTDLFGPVKQWCDQAGVLLTLKYVRLLQGQRNSEDNVKGFELSLCKALEALCDGDIPHGNDSWEGFGSQKQLGKWCFLCQSNRYIVEKCI